MHLLVRLSFVASYGKIQQLSHSTQDSCIVYFHMERAKKQNDIMKRPLAEAGEMVQRLWALAALREDQSSIPSVDIIAHNHLNLQSQDSSALFWPLWTYQAYTCCLDIQAKKLPIFIK